LYRPTPNEVRKSCKPEERIQNGSKSQFEFEMEESMYVDFIPENKFVQVSITSRSKLRIEHGISHWKGLEQWKINDHPEIR
jgi:hypothetical protein